MSQHNRVTPLPGTSAAVVTPSDTGRFPQSLIYVGGAGAVAVMPADEVGPVTFAALPVGATVPVLCVAVYSTGTTATNLVRVG